MDLAEFDRRPIVVAITGPNGAGKSTFYHAHLAQAGLRFVNADILAEGLSTAPYDAARLAGSLRQTLIEREESFVFETVFSDPAGDKLEFLEDAERRGYEVVLCFIGLANWRLSRERVAMRVSQGGHDVPGEKLKTRYPRTLANLRQAVHRLPHVRVYDNSDLSEPYRLVAVFNRGNPLLLKKPLPAWLRPVLR